jgi:hypothetical protein
MLPDNIKGQWVWCRGATTGVEEHLFLRREFVLAETPSSAELWVSARTFFHVYLNGRHLGFGPPSASWTDTYVLSINASFFLQTGLNVISVLAHNSSVTSNGQHYQPSGFWCQLNIDNKPALWSDEDWLVLPGDAYEGKRPRRSPAGDFTEKLDLRAFPHLWTEENFSPKNWQSARVLPDNDDLQLKFAHVPEFNSILQEFPRIVERGTTQTARALYSFSFCQLASRHGTNLYAAEAYLYCPEQQELSCNLYNDNPYRFFVNDTLVNEQGVRELVSGTNLRAYSLPCFSQSDLSSPHCTLVLNQGWNRLLILQQAEPDCAAASLIFPNSQPDEILLHQQAEDSAPEGWTLSGPFRTPLPQCGPWIDTSLPKEFLDVSTSADTRDEGICLAARDFIPGPTPANKPNGFSLKENEYVILELPGTVWGCPEFQIEGGEGDVVHLTCSERLPDQSRLAPDAYSQDVDTIVCSSLATRFVGCRPRGVRYLLIHASRAAEKITLAQVGIRRREFLFDNEGQFDCSDETLNQIWKTGRRTLMGTVQDNFIDGPAGENAQYLADAVIQAGAAVHVFGCYDLAIRAIRHFAEAQFETGELPALCPGDLYMNIPDFSLQWPVWLQRHYLYTGDLQSLKALQPNLKALFNYFEHMAESEDGVLGKTLSESGARCFIDHASIDRQGVVTGLNAIYSRSLFCGAWLLEQLADHSGAAQLRQRAAKVIRTMRSLAWVPQRQLFADAWHDGQASEDFSWQTNVLAIYGGLVDEEKNVELFERLFQIEAPYEPLIESDANFPYFRSYVLETAAAIGKRDWGLKMLCEYWGGMLERGATTWWEHFDPALPAEQVPQGSLCHGAATSPAMYLCTELVGIRPAKPGFGTVYFSPLVGVTDHVKAQIPTLHGHITVEWQQAEMGQFEAVIDANFPLKVIPVFPPSLAGNVTLHVSDDVTILAESLE